MAWKPFLCPLQDLTRRFGNVKVKKISEEDEKDKNDPLKFFNQGLQQVHPMNVMNEQLKVIFSSVFLLS